MGLMHLKWFCIGALRREKGILSSIFALLLLEYPWQKSYCPDSLFHLNFLYEISL